MLQEEWLKDDVFAYVDVCEDVTLLVSFGSENPLP